jgi:O-antigen/teichoic acid export membrane protein
MTILAGLGDQKFTSLGLSGRAHLLAFMVTFVGAWFVLRLLRRRQMRGKYTLLWMVVVLILLAIAAFPGIVDHTSRWLHIYYAPSTLFLGAIGFLLLVCVYFSYELSRLEERTRILAEELAIVRGSHDDDVAARQQHR